MRLGLAVLIVSALGAGALALAIGGDDAPARRQRGSGPVAVSVAPVERGAITRRRTFGGTLEPSTRVVLASRVEGRLEALETDLGDRVVEGSVVARIDDDELRELARAARAELELARARAREAAGQARLAERALERREALKARGAVADAQLETAEAEALTAAAAAEVAAAEVARTRAALDAARVRLGYASLEASWRGPEATLVVAERHAREGDALRPGDPVLTLVGLDPLTVVIRASERDYRFLRAGLRAEVRVDAWPGEVFTATVARFPPAFDAATREIPVELTVPNPEGRLAPGMFAEVALGLETVRETTIVPLAALTRRAETPGVFRVEGDTVRWVEVEPGLRDRGRLAIAHPRLEGQVVILGQRLLDDGARIVVPDARAANGHGPAPEEDQPRR
jgi:RND family efflux transporter MFP subunit